MPNDETCSRRNPHTPHGMCAGLAPEAGEPIETIPGIRWFTVWSRDLPEALNAEMSYTTGHVFTADRADAATAACIRCGTEAMIIPQRAIRLVCVPDDTPCLMEQAGLAFEIRPDCGIDRILDGQREEFLRPLRPRYLAPMIIKLLHEAFQLGAAHGECGDRELAAWIGGEGLQRNEATGRDYYPGCPAYHIDWEAKEIYLELDGQRHHRLDWFRRPGRAYASFDHVYRAVDSALHSGQRLGSA